MKNIRLTHAVRRELYKEFRPWTPLNRRQLLVRWCKGKYQALKRAMGV